MEREQLIKKILKEGLNLPYKPPTQAEIWFKNLLDRMKQLIDPDHDHIIVFHIDGKIMLMYYIDKQYLIYRVHDIYSILNDKFKLSPKKAKVLIKTMVSKHKKLNIQDIAGHSPINELTLNTIQKMLSTGNKNIKPTKISY